MPTPLAADFYYLTNFQTVLDWVRERYADLLTAEELAFAQDFSALPQLSQALLVRLVMRKGPHFRSLMQRWAISPQPPRRCYNVAG